MFEDEKDVKLASSTNEEATVNTTEEVVESAPVEQTENEATTPEYVDSNSDPELEKKNANGVPWKNMAVEWKRKLQETTDRLPQIIQEEIRKASEQQGKQKYSVQELEQFALENPQHRPWVEAEKYKLLKEELEASQNTRLEKERQTIQLQAKRQESEQWVTKTYPDVFVKDNSGRVTGWNQNHPMTGLISQYMSDPRIQAQPDGLMVAAKLAYADYATSKMSTTQSQVKKLKTEVKKIQQKTLTEGGSRPASITSDTRKTAIEQLSRTGSEKDARSAVREILKHSGLIKE